MTHSSRTPIDARPAQPFANPAAAPMPRFALRAGALLSWLAIVAVGGILETGIAAAQVHSSSAPGDPISEPGGPDMGWSARAGLGFTANPTTFLLNFEAPYSFNEWLAVGPMLQVGIDEEDDYTIVAPTMNVMLKYPDLRGTGFDRVVPYAFAGLGLAVIDDDNANNDKTSTGFLIDVGAGVEYQLTDRLFLGTQMMFDFLPSQTQGQHFIFAWQVGGLRYAF